MQPTEDDGKYAFVVITKASKPDAKGRTLMRKHVMKPHGKARRKPKCVATGPSNGRCHNVSETYSAHQSSHKPSPDTFGSTYQADSTLASGARSPTRSHYAAYMSEAPNELPTWNSLPWPSFQPRQPDSPTGRLSSPYPIGMNSWAYEAVDHSQYVHHNSKSFD